MAQDDKGGAKGLGQKAPASRTRASSGTRLSVPSPSLPPPLPSQPRRTLVGIGDDPPAPPPPSRARTQSSLDAAWDDGDDVTNVYPDEPTRPFGKEPEPEEPDVEDEKTRELPARPPAAPPSTLPADAPRRKATLLGVAPPAVLPTLSRPPSLPPRATAPSAPGGFPGARPSAAPRPSSPSIPPRLAPPPLRGPATVPPRGPAMPAFGMPPALEPRAASAGHSVPVIRMARTVPPPRHGVWPSRLAATLGAAAVLVLLIFLRMPGQGKILVNVRDSRGGAVNRLEVFVDGERTRCATAPCYLPYVAGEHEVKVIATGFDVPATQAVVIKSGDSTAIEFVLGASSGSGIKVNGSQPGVKLLVDDKEIGPLPQVLRDVPPGDHAIRIAGSERYQPLVRHVTVERDRVEDLGTVTLKVLKGNVTVNLGTPGAHVFIVSGSDRRELPMLPISLDIETSRSWALEGTKAGYQEYRQPISFDDGLADKTYTVALEPRAAGAPAVAAPAYEPVATPSPPAYPPATPAPRSSPPGGASRGGEAGGGYLNINSIPPSTCYLDGKALGSTPRLHVPVSAGSHTVKFRDPDSGSTKTVNVTVGAGETKLAAARLD
jgi:hypothetical protein